MLVGKATKALYANVDTPELYSTTGVPHGSESGPGTLGASKPASLEMAWAACSPRVPAKTKC